MMKQSMRKVLAVVLCLAAILSVMTAVAYASGQTQATPSLQADRPTEEQTTKPVTTTVKELSSLEKLDAWWADFYPQFDALYNSGFRVVVDVLVAGFRFLLKIAGLDLWGGLVGL